ncbi:K+-dependent Na+:Ca2+ antiporter domain-containing protein [Dioscorea alata]|uniref:K+-dependent Na+:Ca2+ antiporter domain-containing protein n=1 Tax=Dioscorea alata TaxID=55571 RepID=A0ACB7V002_DIOAL|nr:K+-dependent Na+:Ca2+ antiporter domain-containing protein [Dioscorea alata]
MAWRQGKPVHLFLNSSFFFLTLFFITAHFNSSYPVLSGHPRRHSLDHSIFFVGDSSSCENLLHHDSHISSQGGYINYLLVFYCICDTNTVLGYGILILWLILLFYLLGNTAASYFCSSLQGLATILKLSPSIAGVTLLSLGNGAPDVFSTIASSTTTNTSSLSLYTVLGGAFFVSTVVVGIISICVGPKQLFIDKTSFIRDVTYLLLALSLLVVILLLEKINLFGAIAFSSLYPIYVVIVSVTHCYQRDFEELEEAPPPHLVESLLLLPIAIENDCNEAKNKNRRIIDKLRARAWFFIGRIAVYLLELPLSLPRRLTIPDVCEKRWCKPFAVISVTLAPLLLSLLWNSKMEAIGSKDSIIIYAISCLIGLILGITAFLTTNSSKPPSKTLVLLPWLAAGFLMSMTWTYIIAEELVSLMVSIGTILNISSSVLGLTVLAWGNSLGDLVSNVAVAMNGGQNGVQVAISGCFAGPIFNILIGLSISFFLKSWNEFLSCVEIPLDLSLLQTFGFMFGSLLWSLVILPKRGMKLDKVLGSGLISIYLCFLSVRLVQSLGLINL